MSVQILPGQNAVTCDTEDASRHEDESDVDLILSIFREFIAFRGKKNIPRYYRGDDTRLHLRISGFDSVLYTFKRRTSSFLWGWWGWWEGRMRGSVRTTQLK